MTVPVEWGWKVWGGGEGIHCDCPCRVGVEGGGGGYTVTVPVEWGWKVGGTL